METKLHWVIEDKVGSGYPSLVSEIVGVGQSLDSRVGNTFEVLGAQVRFPAGAMFQRPGMARKLGWVELLEVLAGSFQPALYRLAAPKLRWAYTIQQAYGIRLATQFPLVAEQLRANPASRRALLYIGQPGDGREEEKPCVSLLQFLGRRGRLDMVATIRSWDAISGFVYDTMVMGAIVQAMAEVLGLEPGTVYANAGSLHVYEADLARVPVNDAQKSFSLRLNGRLEWEDVAEWARVQLVNFSLWGAYPPEGIEVK